MIGAAIFANFLKATMYYFQSVGTHRSVLTDKNSNSVPDDLILLSAHIAADRLSWVKISRDIYATPAKIDDRDYVHNMSLREGHSAAVDVISAEEVLFNAFNLGVSQGQGIFKQKDVLEGFSSRLIPGRTVSKRAGDVSAFYASACSAVASFDWIATTPPDEMRHSTRKFQTSKAH